MVQCQCLKSNGKQCTRDASIKLGDNSLFCWQHQKCQKSVEPIPPTIKKPLPLKVTKEPIPLKVVTEPVLPKVIKKPIPLKVIKKPVSQLIDYDQFAKIYPEKEII